jgi:CheY-like chemotaxis protein
MNILLVADSDWVVNQMRAALGGTHHITETADPDEAQTLVSEIDADVIVIDLQVGSMGGMALTRSFKSAAAAGEAPDASIVLLLDRSADESIAKRSGADAWIVKPFTSQDLRSTLSGVAAATA